MSILITGASGLVGEYLTRYLTSRKLDIISSSRNPINTTSIKLDITNKNDFNNLPESIDTVIHLASIIPTESFLPPADITFNINGLGTYNLLNWCLYKGIEKVIYTSTVMVYGYPKYLPIDENHPTLPRGQKGNYGLSKLLGELFCLRFQEDFKLRCTILRLSQIYGLDKKPGYVLNKFINLAEEGKDLIIYGRGDTKRDLLYVKDLGLLMEKLLNSENPGIYNIGSGIQTSITNIAETLINLYNSGSTLKYENTLKEDRTNIILDISKAQKELNFKPTYTLKEGLKDLKLSKENKLEDF